MNHRDTIEIRGAREHNLKTIDLDLPRGKIVVLTGVSGSGKSSLAFDTLFAEGQRRYAEGLSLALRQQLGRWTRPDFTSIRGLPPALALDQATSTPHPRATVGTISEISDFLRVLFAKVATQHCQACDTVVRRSSAAEICRIIMGQPDGARFSLLAPIDTQGRSFFEALSDARKRGFVRCRIDGISYHLQESIAVDARLPHRLEIIVDRLEVEPGLVSRLNDSLETTLKQGNQRCIVVYSDGVEDLYSTRPECPNCHTPIVDRSPQLFSFNHMEGMCRDCQGLGITQEMIEEKGPKPKRRVHEEGDEDEESDPTFDSTCQSCHGQRLRPESLGFRLGNLSLGSLQHLSLERCSTYLENLTFAGVEARIASELYREIQFRLNLLLELGLSYLSLDRRGTTLSGGEAQRIRLAGQIGGDLTGVLYILDEPSVGLHPRDSALLVSSLKRLRDHGNTVLVVEHDPTVIAAAEFLVDFGPGAGERGGEILFAGDPTQFASCSQSPTAAYLTGSKIVSRNFHSPPTKHWLEVEGAVEQNLKDVSIRIPLGALVAITGVSGAGKSTLVDRILFPAILSKIRRKPYPCGQFRQLRGAETVQRVVRVDQRAIGRSARSVPGTYAKVLDPIRKLFAQLPEAKALGWNAGRFSFNAKGGRCEACEGEGIRRIDMQYLADLRVRCDICRGRRFNDSTLEVRYKGLSIADVLEKPVDDLYPIFRHHPAIAPILFTLIDVGLGYLTLGQPSPTLSGGEAQRLKLSRELGQDLSGGTLYLLDEPTSGLHSADIQQLIILLEHLIEAGNSVLVIEHNLELIRCADYCIELGPEGGDAGGYLVFSGTVPELMRHPTSHTGNALRTTIPTFQIPSR